MGVKVAKFGGSSVADASQLRKVQAIVRSDPQRSIVVVSAPGKRTPDDTKITDLLYKCHDCVRDGVPFDRIFEAVADRYRAIVEDLNLAIDIERDLDSVRGGIALEMGRAQV